MKILPGIGKVVAEDDLWEYMNENRDFNDFVGECVSHFAHFVVPGQDSAMEIAQDYQVPVDIDEVGGETIMLTRRDGNVIFIEFWRW